MSVRYRVFDVPAMGAGAFMPTPSTNAPASSWGLVLVDGAPGTEPVPAPSPQSAYLPSLTARGGVDSAQGSMVSPDVILPSVYVARADNMGPAADAGIGMRTRRLAPMPVPSFSYPRIPIPAQTPARIGGRRTMVWPRSFQRFAPTTVAP